MQAKIDTLENDFRELFSKSSETLERALAERERREELAAAKRVVRGEPRVKRHHARKRDVAVSARRR